jgi:methylthioribose-1-phosphate isomerase
MRVKTIQWKNDQVIMLDQRLLPHKEINRVCRDYKEVAARLRLVLLLLWEWRSEL